MTKSKTPNIGSYVAWKWGYGVAEGEVIAITSDRTQIESKGKIIVRNGTAANPALTIVHTNGALVLKLTSEVQVVG